MSRRGRRSSRGRKINGILLLDKPVGLTSNEALQRVKQLYRARKAGHTGSLDKMASGLLPLCFGEATKFSGFLLNADKHYLATCKLGERTTTGDALGEIIETRPIPVLAGAEIDSVLADFRGRIKQIPPMYSALKHKGQRLYELAYQGIEIERAPREITVYSLERRSFQDDLLELAVHCSKGTYIRTLAEDIGERLGCGAHVTRLRRTGAGPFSETEMISLERLEELANQGMEVLDSLLLGIDAALQDYPEVELNSSVASYVCDGQAVLVPHAPTCGMLRLYDDRRNFLGVGEVLDDGRIEPRRLARPGNRGDQA